MPPPCALIIVRAFAAAGYAKQGDTLRLSGLGVDGDKLAFLYPVQSSTMGIVSQCLYRRE